MLDNEHVRLDLILRGLEIPELFGVCPAASKGQDEGRTGWEGRGLENEGRSTHVFVTLFLQAWKDKGFLPMYNPIVGEHLGGDCPGVKTYCLADENKAQAALG